MSGVQPSTWTLLLQRPGKNPSLPEMDRTLPYACITFAKKYIFVVRWS